MAFVTPNSLPEKVWQLLREMGVPTDQTSRMTISIEAGNIVTAECVIALRVPKGDLGGFDIEQVTKRYRLVEVEEDEAEVAAVIETEEQLRDYFDRLKAEDAT